MATRSNEPIAIIGSSCRFPGESTTPSKLWELLQNPRDVLRDIKCFSVKGFYHPNGEHHGATNVRHSYFISEDTRRFDAQFFNITPREADTIDPQQKSLLEIVYEAMESAGLDLKVMQGSQTAVYVGIMCSDWNNILLRDPDNIPQYFATSVSPSILSNRISYFFDWHGPSMTIDTACSSSLVAIHQAVQTLRNGTSRTAVAAGTNLIFGPEVYIAESNLHMLSPTGRSHMWDADADGYARGEGVAAVILKTLSAALEDGDHIECIIRETGVNQDGRTKGITMPSARSQASLIRQTYEKAGLDWRKPEDRCQFFEAHGTGTPAGDPQEAEAIRTAFYGPNGEYAHEGDLMHVGSVKTVIGHTEGTAGLAGVLKASLAVQAGLIPPNMLFNSLAPAVAPFYLNLKIPTTLTQWPAVPEGAPRRASVNSFGFGGTNAHAIIESYVCSDAYPGKIMNSVSETRLNNFMPLVLSACSESSLAAIIAAYSTYLKTTASTNLHHLLWTLSARRSMHPIKATFSGLTREDLTTKMDSELRNAQDTPGVVIGTRSLTKPTRILGVFTGQGAQWAAMGKDLIVSSLMFRNIIETLEQSLNELPTSDRPVWSLKEEIMAEAPRSRLSEAALSQPLCTAIQVALILVLFQAEITFDAVLGHSSGEIAAAFAAGFISATDAVRIAYYRGFHVKHARGPQGHNGAMMAVETSAADVRELCKMPEFEGRVTLAASNSPTSVTVSGDHDAVYELKDIFEEEKRFARVLKVDTAYHSHHMYPCSEPYLESLRACSIKVQDPKSSTCSWFSSVDNDLARGVVEVSDALAGEYWRDNMVNCVLFSQAVESAVQNGGPFDFILEVGPHPALKGPVSDTIKAITGTSIPYHGVLSRGQNDVEALSTALGAIWKQLGSSAINFDKYRLAFDEATPKLVKGLPAYAWDHDREFWGEPRVSKRFRTRDHAIHELLGTRASLESDQELQWRNIIKLEEIPWLRGHQLQGQIVFPGAGYVSMAIEASKALAEDQKIQSIEISDLVIYRAIAFNENSAGVETLFTLKKRLDSVNSKSTRVGDFSCYSVENGETGTMSLVFSGGVSIVLGQPLPDLLPTRSPSAPNMSKIDVESFYSGLDDLGYGYSSLFRALSSAKRKLNMASGKISRPTSQDLERTLMVHPALLDVAFQSIFAGFSAPGDGRLWTLHVPTKIRRIRVNPSLCYERLGQDVQMPFDSFVTQDISSGILGDVEIFSSIHSERMMIQVTGLHCVPLAAASSTDDRQLFARTVWAGDGPCSDTLVIDTPDSSREIELMELCERVAYYYMRALDNEIRREGGTHLEWHHKRFLEFIEHYLPLIANGSHPTVKEEWESDTHDEIMNLVDKYRDEPVLDIMKAVGENLPSVFRGQSTILEHMRENNLLDRFYRDGLGFPRANTYLASMVGQLSHRYQRMSILEIGAGTGGATRDILRKLNGHFQSYTYTDISTGFFENAKKTFRVHDNKMIFGLLDIEKDVVAQGYQEHSYDLIIASNVLHATQTLSRTMANVRRLLRPGGHLLLLEVTGETIRTGFIMSGLPGWWLGGDDGRRYNPGISPVAWNSLLVETGFSGVDTICLDMHDPARHTYSILASQAVDQRITFLRDPLSSIYLTPPGENLFIVGGTTLQVLKLVQSLVRLLRRWFKAVNVVSSLESLDKNLSSNSTILSVTELDKPVLKDLTAKKQEKMKYLFDKAQNVLWITRGSRAENPYHNMMVAIGRSLKYELPQLRLQFLDVDFYERIESQTNIIAEALLRLHGTSDWNVDEGQENSILWSMEPELACENGQLLIPRIIPDTTLNDRLNSSRRLITKNVFPQNTTVKLVRRSNRSCALEDSLSSTRTRLPTEVIIRLSHSVLSAIHIAQLRDSYLYLCFGSVVETGETVLTLAAENASILKVRKNSIYPCSVPIGEEDHLLSSLAVNLVVQSIVSSVSSGKTLLLHEPEETLASALSLRASIMGITLVCTTCKSRTEGSNMRWVSIHPHASERVIKDILPRNPELVVDFSMTHDEQTVCARIVECVSPVCTWPVFRTTSILKATDLDMQRIPEILREAYQLSAATFETTPHLSLSNVLDETLQKHPLSVVHWITQSTIPVRVNPVDPKTLFVDNKTYLLIGLTGELGQSLCQWMVENGARWIVVTSRNPDPKIDHTWLESLRDMGATVQIYAMDVSNKTSLASVRDRVRATLPPIAGVANGAMVLRDKMFNDMTFEELDSVLKPKVDGTRWLDELFAEDTLDFFILFSSLSCVIGNSGQANYGAANAFMTSLAVQRRKRGLAASVIDIGAILGIGYIARSGRAIIDETIRKYFYMRLSESEFHIIFAEAVLAGRADSDESPELITGIRPVLPDDDIKPRWYHNPRFSYYILHTEKTQEEIEMKETAVPLKKRLAGAATYDEIGAILREAFVAKLISILQLPPDGFGEGVSLIEMGVDSLVAVEVRTWFLKELNTDMPVLKVLGGGTAADLCADALERLPAELTPRLNTKTTVAVTNPVMSSSHVQELSSPESSAQDYYGPDLSSPGKDTFPETPDTRSDIGINEYRNEPKAMMQRTERLSYGQARLWFLNVYLQNDPSTFNVTIKYHIEGALRIVDFERAVQVVAQRHEALRTCFLADPGAFDQGRQVVLDKSYLLLERKQVSSAAAADEEFTRVRDHAYDLGMGKTAKIILVSDSPTSHCMILGFHHIVMDGVSVQIFLSDLEKAYNGRLLGPPAVQYVDFTTRQHKLVETGGIDKSLEFWQKEFPTIPEPLPLFPFARVRSRRTLKTYQFNKVDLWPEPALVARIKQVCSKLKVTQFHFYLATLEALLYRFLGTEDLCLGIVDANRNDEDLSDTIGYFMNLLPLRFRLQRGQRFVDTVRESRTKTYSAMAHGSVPIDMIFDKLNVPRSATHSPLFQALVNYRLGDLEKIPFGTGCVLEATDASPGRTAYDISFDFTDSTRGISLFTLWSQKSLYTREDSEVIMNSYLNLLDAFSRNTAIRLDDAPLFSKPDFQAAATIGHGKYHQSEWPGTLSHRVDDVAAVNANKVALRDSHNSLTYKQMIDRSNVIATALLKSGVADGARVAVFQEPSSDWICSILAIFRVGASYIPLDLRNPIARLSAIVNDCAPTAVLIHDETAEESSELLHKVPQTTVVDITSLGREAKEDVPTRAEADSPAVILYTSGSTGTPKGIVLKHHSIRNQAEEVTRECRLGGETVLQQSSLGFDLSLDQIFVALANGGMLYIVARATRADPIELTKLMETERVTYTMAAPSEYSLWIRYGFTNLKKCTWWRMASSCGEVLTEVVKQKFKKLDMPKLSLWNAYGPAEATVSSTRMKVPLVGNESDTSKDDFFPVGPPLPNYSVYVVDENLKPVPIGMPGEILLGGAGTAAGYVTQHDLTAAKFVVDDYSPPHYAAEGWKNMYRTGDKGRWRHDGSLIYLGRLDGDTQIKLRGLRIELQDIESTIIQVSDGAVTEAIVSIRGDPEFLVAHVVLAPESSSADSKRVLKQISHSLPLPHYMRPSIIIPLENMPLNSNGKTDRKAISTRPLPEIQISAERDIALNETEAKLMECWKEVLPEDIAKLQIITTDSDFFQVGGSSLLIVRLQSALRITFGILIPLVELFQSSVFSSMAAKITASPLISTTTINWEEETVLDKDALQQSALLGYEMKKPIYKENLIVLLTGATGFLGQSILKYLVEDSRVAQVHCVAVRQSNKLRIGSEKITVHSGDLSDVKLGLSESSFSLLSSEVDVIVHNGADVSFLKTYQSLRKPNVASTKDLIELAFPRKIPFHFVSTGGVQWLTGQKNALSEVSIGHLSPPTDGSNGYVSSKWASERFLEDASQQLDIPVRIHRPANITGAGAPALDIVHNFLRFATLMKSMPSLEAWPGRFDLIPVEVVARNICEELSVESNSVEFVHHCSDIKLTVPQLRERLEKEGACKFDTVPLVDWVSRARGLGLDHMVAAFIENLNIADEKSALPLLVKTKGTNR